MLRISSKIDKNDLKMLKNDLKMIPSGSKMFPNNLLGQRLGPSGYSGIDLGASGVDFRSIFEPFLVKVRWVPTLFLLVFGVFGVISEDL